ncbi:MAG: phenylacetate--CoA ligase family protein [Gaiellaceae bacterium]
MIFQPELETMPVEERADEQRRRLSGLIARLKGVEGYWRDKLAVVSPDDELGDLPFTTKRELLERYPYGLLAVPLEQTVRIHASSGTRHKPTIVAYTAADIELFADVNARSICCAGATPDDVIHVAYGYGLFTGGLGLHYGVECLGATAVPASGGNSGFQVQLLADLGARGICCTPSFCYLLSERAEEHSVLDQIQLRYGVLGAEPWSESLRQKIEQAWGEFDACDIYGLSEVIGPGVAMECRENKGGLHVFDDHFVPEVVDPETGEPTDGVGELVLTTLTKEALPMIRYRTGDVTQLLPGDCPCGRTHQRIARFSGRVDDMLVIRGVNVFPSAIEAALLEHPDLAGQYAIVVDRRTALPELEVHAELASEALISKRDDVERILDDVLEERLNLRLRVVLLEPGGLPRQELGKAKRVFERTEEKDELLELR